MVKRHVTETLPACLHSHDDSDVDSTHLSNLADRGETLDTTHEDYTSQYLPVTIVPPWDL